MRDYANRKKEKKSNSKVFFFTLLLALAVIFAWFIHHRFTQQTRHSELTTAPAPRPRPATPSKKVSAKKNKEQFDFYTILPKTTVATPANNNALLTPGTSHYWLQASLTSSKAGATQLTVTLGTLGYATHIQTQDRQNRPRYLVLVGPYDSLSKAQFDQQQLKQQQHPTLLVQIGNKTKQTP